MRALLVALIAGLSLAAQADAQIVPETPPPSDAAPVPETAAEANARAIPGPPVTRTERGAPGRPDIVITTYPGNLEPPPPAAFNKTYPLCTAALQDSCRNPGSGDEEPERGAEETVRPPRG